MPTRNDYSDILELYGTKNEPVANNGVSTDLYLTWAAFMPSVELFLLCCLTNIVVPVGRNQRTHVLISALIVASFAFISRLLLR